VSFAIAFDVDAGGISAAARTQAQELEFVVVLTIDPTADSSSAETMA
jgi:hypothetical protein